MSKEIEQRIDWINKRVPLDGIQISYIKFQMQEHTKQLTDEIAELKSKVSNWMDKYIEVNEENKQLKSELKDKESVNEKIIESLNYVRNNPKTWKAGGIGGQDQYAGMPSMLRYIDEIISNLTNQNK